MYLKQLSIWSTIQLAVLIERKHKHTFEYSTQQTIGINLGKFTIENLRSLTVYNFHNKMKLVSVHG